MGVMVAWLSGEGLRAGRVALSPPLLWVGGPWRVVVVSIWLLGPGSSQKGTIWSWEYPSGLRFPWTLDSSQEASTIYFCCDKNA